MRLRWTGPGNVVRSVTGPAGQTYEWSEAAGLEQEVDEETALELLTAPGESFEVVQDEGWTTMDEGQAASEDGMAAPAGEQEE